MPYCHAKGYNRYLGCGEGPRVNNGGLTLVACISTLIKTKIFWPKEDPKSRIEGVFSPNIAWPLHGVKLLGGLASADFDFTHFSSKLVMKRVAKAIGLIDAVAKINDPRSGKEVDIGLDRGRDKPLCPTDMLVYSWDEGLDLYVGLTCSSPLTRSSPLTQTRLADFAPPYCAVSDTTHRKRVKYKVKCGDIEAHAAIHIFNRINFAISKGVDGKEVDIGLDGRRDKLLRPADMFLYSWDKGLDACMNMTGSSPLTGGCRYTAQANPEVLHDSRYWGTCCSSYLFNRIDFAIIKEEECVDPTKVDLKVLRDSRHCSTCCCSYF
nr:hypothetical protein [Tanacetum cinerariifolium]